MKTWAALQYLVVFYNFICFKQNRNYHFESITYTCILYKRFPFASCAFSVAFCFRFSFSANKWIQLDPILQIFSHNFVLLLSHSISLKCAIVFIDSMLTNKWYEYENHMKFIICFKQRFFLILVMGFCDAHKNLITSYNILH